MLPKQARYQLRHTPTLVVPLGAAPSPAAYKTAALLLSYRTLVLKTGVEPAILSETGSKPAA